MHVIKGCPLTLVCTTVAPNRANTLETAWPGGLVGHVHDLCSMGRKRANMSILLLPNDILQSRLPGIALLSMWRMACTTYLTLRRG